MPELPSLFDNGLREIFALIAGLGEWTSLA